MSKKQKHRKRKRAYKYYTTDWSVMFGHLRSIIANPAPELVMNTAMTDWLTDCEELFPSEYSDQVVPYLQSLSDHHPDAVVVFLEGNASELREACTHYPFAYFHLCVSRPRIKALVKTPFFQRVRHIKFRAPILPEEFDTISKSKYAVNVRSLRMSKKCKLMQEHFERFSCFKKLPSMTRLDLSDSGPLNMDAIEALCDSGITHQLEALLLQHNDLSFIEARTLARRGDWDNLKLLNLYDNRIGPKGTEHLMRSPKFKGLESLNLARNYLGDVGAIEIASSPHMTNLTHLSILHNEIGKPGKEALANSPYLKDEVREMWESWIARDKKH